MVSTTDDTAAIQAALDAAGTSGTGVWFPPASGECYRTTGGPVPRALGNSYGEATASAPVADKARSRVRREDVGDGSAAEDGGAHRLDAAM